MTGQSLRSICIGHANKKFNFENEFASTRIGYKASKNNVKKESTSVRSKSISTKHRRSLSQIINVTAA